MDLCGAVTSVRSPCFPWLRQGMGPDLDMPSHLFFPRYSHLPLAWKWDCYSLSCVQLFVTPWTVSFQVTLFMELFRQEYWSGLPFPSPGDLPNLRIEPRSPAMQADSLPAEPQGKPKNTVVGSLSLLQRIFLTQESNPDFLHYRQILYQLSYQGSPYFIGEETQ